MKEVLKHIIKDLEEGVLSIQENGGAESVKSWYHHEGVLITGEEARAIIYYLSLCKDMHVAFENASSMGIDSLINVEITKEEALSAMRSGKKIWNKRFLPEEFLFMKDDNIFSEDGYDHGTEYDLFWKESQIWPDGWYLWIQK